ncbi:tyrosine-protein phosphatase [Herbiconiux moechotypicola]|uniref:Tyrosine specific protein phosphatases domain-containing protein n=1 Tax=Herbiconiux moechotypicola TaxID=637393 RepID=A0ABP5Q5K1_9MICO|nr:tyrosine-protein phosphatase [Herbiconiux moechotypicola]MCS5728840.1 tyrosine-protein phosphatase [Herbiconiux moechotypicola]
MDTTARLSITHNSRDLGGLPISGGGSVAPGVLYRSDALSTLTEEGVAAFAELGIGTIVDLRTDAERARAADHLPADGSVLIVPLPVQGGAMDELVQSLLPTAGSDTALSDEQIAAIAEQIPTLEDLYRAILGSSAVQFAEVARTVITASDTDRPGVVFHCTAGKDRTGLAAALLLCVAGVPREAIVADYVQTGTNLAGGLAEALIALVTSLGVPLTPRLRTLATESPASAIEAALDWVAAEHGDAAGYLRSGGLTEAEVARLAEVLRAG